VQVLSVPVAEESLASLAKLEAVAFVAIISYCSVALELEFYYLFFLLISFNLSYSLSNFCPD